MRILISGGQGQLGSDCSRVLAPEHTVFAFGSGELDIASEDQVLKTVTDIRPDIVINCGAYTGVDACESDRDNCWRVNADGPDCLARCSNGIGARLIHVSTDYVFDGTRKPPHPYRESDPVGPVSEYGSSKLAGEQKVRENLENHLIIRTAWLYGIDGKNFLKTMLRLALAAPDRTIRVVNDQFGSLTWTYRLAVQIRALLDSDLRGTIHATAEGFGTWYTGAMTFLEAMKVPFSLEPCATSEYPTPAKRPANSILANSRLEKEGLNSMETWEKDVRTFAERHRDQLLEEAQG